VSDDKDSTFATVLLWLLCIPLAALAIWFIWNHWTDPEHPLVFGYVFLTVAIMKLASGVVYAAAWLIGGRK
jgi:hypothetical protein